MATGKEKREENENSKPKVGLVTLLDPRTEFYEYMLKSGINLKQSNEFQHNLLKKTLAEKGSLDVLDGGFIDSSEKAKDLVGDLIAVKGKSA